MAMTDALPAEASNGHAHRNGSAPSKDWVKVQVRPETYARLTHWVEAQYPDVRMRPPKREAAELLLSLALDQAEEAIKPQPSALDRLAALRDGRGQ